MSQHFRTAVMTVILAGGTLVSYAAAYATITKPAPITAVATQQVRTSAALAKRIAPFQKDVSAREACSSFEGVGERTRCIQEIAGTKRPVRVIDLVATGAPAARG